MKANLGQALRGFADAVSALREHLAPYPALCEPAFAGTEEWQRLLTYKLLPNLGENGCLVAAVAGGTNTGKSTVFNLLVHTDLSPMRSTAAATCRPVLAGNAERLAQCLEGGLVAGFTPLALDNPEWLISTDTPEDALYAARCESLPAHLVLLDIPDVDSIDKKNWEVAENIQAAGDVLIGVLTGEKYKDDKVIAFFRHAHAAGRMVVPLMNKADTRDDFAVARAQLADFCKETGLDAPVCFAVPHDFTIASDLSRPIAALEGGVSLRDYLEGLDVAAIKQRVYRESVTHFASRTREFVESLCAIADELRGVVAEFESRGESCAFGDEGLNSRGYDPEPDEHVGALLHEFIRAKRGWLARRMGETGDLMRTYLAPAGRAIARGVRSRLNLEKAEEAPGPEEIRAAHGRQAATIARHLAQEYVQRAGNLKDAASSLVSHALESLDLENAVEAIANDMRESAVSEAFRDHVLRNLDAWWMDKPMRRQLLLELDTLLMTAPTALAVGLSLYSGGIGAPEVAALAGPLAGEAFSRIMEYQLADKWSELIAPWRREQQERYLAALRCHLIRPVLREIEDVLALLEGEVLDQLRDCHEQCLKAS